MKTKTNLGELSEERYKDEIVASILMLVVEFDTQGVEIETGESISNFRRVWEYRSSFNSSRWYKLENLPVKKLKQIFANLYFAKEIE